MSLQRLPPHSWPPGRVLFTQMKQVLSNGCLADLDREFRPVVGEVRRGIYPCGR